VDKSGVQDNSFEVKQSNGVIIKELVAVLDDEKAKMWNFRYGMRNIEYNSQIYNFIMLALSNE